MSICHLNTLELVHSVGFQESANLSDPDNRSTRFVSLNLQTNTHLNAKDRSG